MNGYLPIVMFGAGGVLLGGALSMRSQGAGRVPMLVVGVLALLAMAGGAFWLIGIES